MPTLSLRACLTNIGEPTILPLGIWSSPHFGGRVPASLRAAMAGMTDPRVSQWGEVGIALQSENTDLSEESQGATTDGARWYVCSNNTKQVVAFDDAHNRVATYAPNHVVIYSLWQDDGAPNVDAGPDGFPEIGGTYTFIDGKPVIPSVSPPVWDPHFGAPSYHDGSIYVPIQGVSIRGVWRIALTGSQQWFKAAALPDDDLFAWCAIHPVTGVLYTCNYSHPVWIRGYELGGSSLDRCPQKDCPDYDIRIGPRPLDLDRVQGGVFTRHGRLILVRSDFNAVFCLSSLNGHCFGAQELGDFDHGSSEVEAVTIRGWHFNQVPAQVHISELDNDWPDKDDFYLHSYRVPDAAYL
jgi:hypothetical protein